MKKKILLLVLLVAPLCALWAQKTLPSINPYATFVTVEGEEIDDASTTQSAPLTGHFSAGAKDVGDYSVRYEWTITRNTQSGGSEVIVHRFEEELDYTFTQSGSFAIRLYATFVLDGDTISLPDEGEDNPIMVSISESKLEFPNAFSPNGDGYNDVYKAKDGYQSIVSFQATIFTRWGQKVYSWNRLDEGWDGTWNGRTVNDGVYYVVVNAKGADGRKYNIRKDVNVLTGYDNRKQGGGN